MFSFARRSSLWGLLALAQISYTESNSGMTFNMFTTTEGSNTDLHFNMSIPASNGWGAIGIGDAMPNSLMFVLLPDSTNGSTISVRSAPGHIMPTPLKDVNFTVVQGSMQNGNLMAQAICGGCQKWDSGSLDPTSTSQSFIWAVGPGTSGVSGSGQDASIMMHSVMGTFNVDLTKAAQGAPSSSSSSSSSSSGSSGSSGSSSANSGISGASTTKPVDPMLLAAHAALLPIAFLVLYPLGVVFLRLPALGFMAHVGVQVIAVILTIAGMGIAIHMSMGTYFGKFDVPHQGVGLAATSLAIFQFFLGIIHHVGFRKFQKRWAVSYLHLYTGRIAMILGAINPILGFLLTGKRNAAIGVGVVGLLVVLSALIFGVVADNKNRKAGKSMAEVGSNGSERGMNNQEK